MPPKVERLTFAWWNTALSPLGKDRATEEDFREAAVITSELIHALGVDCLALGEVRGKDLNRLLRDSRAINYATYDGTYHDGRLIGDTGAIYNTQSLDKVNDKKIIVNSGTKRLKVANRVDFTIRDEAQPFHVFISHWPSHLQPNSDSLRVRLGYNLRDEVDELMAVYEDKGYSAPVILMGDYNEEPFSQCLEGALLATRDRTLIRTYPSYLYNPFWRRLGEFVPYTPSSQESTFAGSCFMKKGGYLTTWKTVDQVVVSSAFLGGSSWHLNEELTGILDLRKAAPRAYSSKGFFDHLPVIAVVDKVENTGGQAND